MELNKIRREYRYSALTRRNATAHPADQFRIWLNEARQANVNDFSAMNLITCSPGEFPQSRIVLLKDYNKNGFTFFSNYTSAKAKAMELNNKVGLHFFWPELERQIRIEGLAEKTPRQVSEDYFKSRPLDSQIAACASNQSSEIDSRETLEKQYQKVKDLLAGQTPECPENWGGYFVRPVRIEFWQGRENRLHDRLVYEHNENGWKIKRLSP
ncbi:pyridoxamine 5'-phosphate oxidase [uncultured Draconibacterium sp.]|uniref:pyridoxamine 5'-phosphate oxidase n=1 Tax=uncultured Draconibacterium sp. TaxID=1573823 RepID=UPI0032618E85